MTSSPQSYLAVVGVDGSENSRAALTWAINEAQLRGGGTVNAVMSWTYPPMAAAASAAGGGLPRAELMDEATIESLDDALANVEVPDGVILETVAIEGPPATVLLAEASDASVLVLCKRGHGGFLGLLLGSVATQVTNHAECPVVIVPHA